MTGKRVLPAEGENGAVKRDPSTSKKSNGRGPLGEMELSSVGLGDLLGVNSRTVRKLADEGHVSKVTGRDKYNVAESVKLYVAHLRGIAAGRGGESTVLELSAERARLAKEQADKIALQNAASRGELIPAAEVTGEWRAILTGFRGRLLAVASRIRMAAPHLTREEIDLIDAEIREALTDAANG